MTYRSDPPDAAPQPLSCVDGYHSYAPGDDERICWRCGEPEGTPL